MTTSKEKRCDGVSVCGTGSIAAEQLSKVNKNWWAAGLGNLGLPMSNPPLRKQSEENQIEVFLEMAT